MENVMPVSKKHAAHDATKHTQAPQAAEPLSDLPSSYGDSPKRVTPMDITPEHASWADLKITDVGGDRADCTGRADDTPQMHQAGGSDTAVDTGSDKLPSSYGDSPQEVTPKDITPGDAAWKDVKKREITPINTQQGKQAEQRQESLIDEGSELSFPASDPPAPVPESARCTEGADCESEAEAQLDEAIEFTFPASDPIAVSQITKTPADHKPQRH
jgi:predicted RNase H-like HicB family nuclease